MSTVAGLALIVIASPVAGLRPGRAFDAGFTFTVSCTRRAPRPKREQSSVPHIGPGGIIKEPEPLWPRLRKLLRGS